MQYDTAIPVNDIERMIQAIEPSWRLVDASQTAGGHHAVYRLTVETADATREAYLKATPADKEPTVDLEARVVRLLERHTDIPVPSVLGIVDEHDTFPAPFVLQDALPGNTVMRTAIDSIPDETLRGIARQTGRHLASVHALRPINGYGFLSHQGAVLDGDRPSGSFDTVAVSDPEADWQTQLQAWARGTLDAVGETRFADVGPDARPVLEAAIEEVEEPPAPALARIDQALENILLSEGELTGMLDWEFTIAATPAYDLVAVARSLAGDPYLFAEGVDDRRDVVLDALLAGYSETGPDSVVDWTRRDRACYELLSSLRTMTHLSDWYELFDLEDEIEGAAANLERDVKAHL